MKHEIDLERYQIRTDLISEVIKDKEEGKGYTISKELYGDIAVETIQISKEGEEILQKKEGLYQTIFFEDITDETNFKTVLEVVEKTLKVMLKEEQIKEKATGLIIGLGNKKATPDALGPLVSEKITVTRHFFSLGLSVDDKYRSVASFAPSVMGVTGIETKDIILGVVEKIKPDFLIVVDALAASSIERVNKTIQITNTGIHPGSGVGNNREEISFDTLHIPVIAIGIPTVVDAVTIVSNTLSYLCQHLSFEASQQGNQSLKFVSTYQRDYKDHDKTLSKKEKENIMGLVGTLEEDEIKQLMKEVLLPIGYNLMVTPKDVDFMIEKLSDLLSLSLNHVLHK